MSKCSLVHNCPPRRPLILVQSERKVQERALEESVTASLPMAGCFVALASLLCAAALVTREACGLQDRRWKLVASPTPTTASW